MGRESEHCKTGLNMAGKAGASSEAWFQILGFPKALYSKSKQNPRQHRF
jgi:hypothetical protein